ncbi:lipopolysaccharide kinase [Enemella evansiae]|nr:lipopolysaccharide kinase [Enemella evansiae]
MRRPTACAAFHPWENVPVPRFLSAKPDARLIPLPWDVPLAEWPLEHLVALPRGISRHVVRFIKVGSEVDAAKEVLEHLAIHEYRLLHDLVRMNTPAVQPVAVVTGRVDRDGNPLDPVLVTKHLQFSLPYRSLFNRGVRTETVNRLVDAMVVLLARLHLVGFLWGDVSLSNTLFRRDAGEFAAYLVDAETGELHDQLTDGQREHDLAIARTNLFGEFCDLEAGGMLDESLQPKALVELIESRYRELWQELTGVEEFDDSQIYRIERRVRRLNALGFDVAELDITTDLDGTTIRIQPKVVDAGHHSRRLLRLTGLDTEENQARRLLNDLDTYRARTGQQNADEAVVAHQWLTRCFEPVVHAIPDDLRGKLEAAQIYHEVLEYRWYRSEEAGEEIPLTEAVDGYIGDVLEKLPDEEVSTDNLTPVVTEGGRRLANPFDPSQGYEDEQDTGPIPVDPWEVTAAEEPEPSGYLDINALRAKAAARKA